MKTKAVRLYGENDVRLEEFELPELKDGEILIKIISDSVCMSTYKTIKQGAKHIRVPDDVADNPIIIGHEFCGEIVEVGAKWQDQFKAGDRFAIQPAINYKGSLAAPGYSYKYIGGDATYIVIPSEVMETGSLLSYKGEAFFHGSLAEPVSCVIGAFHAQYHTTNGCYEHKMGIVEGGKMAILAGVGPMGLGAVDYAIHGPRRPKLLVVTDIDDARLARAATLYTVEDAKANGVELVYLNTGCADAVEKLMAISGNTGYDDVMCFAPVRPVVEQGDRILGRDGCLNFFAGPLDPQFRAEFNFYNVHYASTHIVGTSGGNTDDMREALELLAAGKINPAGMVTHIGGIDAVIPTTLNLPNIKGGKKLIYTGINLPLTAIADFAELGKTDPLFAKLAKIVEKSNMLWSTEAEQALLAHFNA